MRQRDKREMKVCIHCSSPTLQVFHPLSAAKALPFSISSLSRSRTIAWKKQPSLWWCTAQKRSCKRNHIAFSFLEDGGDAAESLGVQCPALDASQVKFLMLGILRQWGPPVAVGAMVGAIIARRTLVLVVSVSAIVPFAVWKAMEAEAFHLSRLSYRLLRCGFQNLLITTRLFLVAVIRHVSVAIMRSSTRMMNSVRRSLVPMRSLLPLFTWNQREILGTLALVLHFKSSDRRISNINACIEIVEGMAMSQKGMDVDNKWTHLKDNLFLLKAEVASLSNANSWTVPLTDVPTSSSLALKIPSEKSITFTSLDSKGDKSNQSETDEMHVISDSKIDTITSVDMSGQKSINEIPDILEGLKGVEEGLLNERVASANSASTFAKRAAGGQEHEFPSKELNGIATRNTQPFDIIPVKYSEFEACKQQSKHIDYWFEQDTVGPASLRSVKEQKTQALDKDSSCFVKGSHLDADPDLQKEIACNTTILSLSKIASCAAEDHANSFSDEFGLEKTRSVTDFFMNVKDGDGSKVDAGTVQNEIAPIKPGLNNNYSKEAAWITVKDTSKPDKSKNPILNSFSRKEFSGAVLNRNSPEFTKELPFTREDADLLILTGFSRSFNHGEFQKLMTDGEIALKHGKMGFFGDIEVGESESMFYKAADYFASAAALDPYSVEALGFWGNTLLVHGELKLMLSRELRHSTSASDITLPCWSRHAKGTEPSGSSNQVRLRETRQSVCAECEELLIEAGRKYRKVLSISSGEVRALYNWGLALCFRAKLIAEEGDQNVLQSADRIYLAAADKFEAMMGVSQRYSPSALLNWGLTLKERARLRPSDSVERISLLQQSKQLLLDALRLQPENAQIKSAFVTCCLELKELSERKDFQSRTNKKTIFEMPI